MKIIVREENSFRAERFIYLLEEQHSEKISKINRTSRLVKLINGDEIKVIFKDIDGLRADVAIGESAERLTLTSKEENPVWTIKDLNNYLNGIEVNKKQSNPMSFKIEVDTTDLDLALDRAKELVDLLKKADKLQGRLTIDLNLRSNGRSHIRNKERIEPTPPKLEVY